MSAPERQSQFKRGTAVAAPISFTPAKRAGRDRWDVAKRFALFAAATLGVWILLLSPGGRMLA